MCKCNPLIAAPFCGMPGCDWPDLDPKLQQYARTCSEIAAECSRVKRAASAVFGRPLSDESLALYALYLGANQIDAINYANRMTAAQTMGRAEEQHTFMGIPIIRVHMSSHMRLVPPMLS